MPIQELARDAVVTADRDASIDELAGLMRDEEVGSVVITDDGTPVGIVTDRDVTTRVLAEDIDPGVVTAGDVMSTDPCTVGPDVGFYEAAQVMSENGIRRLPVRDGADELVGIITSDDLTELLAEEQAQLASVVQTQRQPY